MQGSLTLHGAKGQSQVRTCVFGHSLPVENKSCLPLSLSCDISKIVIMTTLHQKFKSNSKIGRASAMYMISLEAQDVEII